MPEPERPRSEDEQFGSGMRGKAERVVALALDACALNSTTAQRADLAYALDVLNEGFLGAAMSLARAAMTSHPKAMAALRSEKHRQSLEEVRAAFVAYRETRRKPV